MYTRVRPCIGPVVGLGCRFALDERKISIFFSASAQLKGTQGVLKDI